MKTRNDKLHGDSVGTAGEGGSDDRERWPGGYVRAGVFVIERKIRGKKFHVSTHCRSLRAAMKQLERFETNPKTYRPEGDAEERLVITLELISGYEDHLIEQRGTSGNYAREMGRHLGQWAAELSDKNLRTLQLSDVLGPLEKGPNRQHRIIALKGFCRWLRQIKGLLRTGQDVTLEVPVPQGSPEKHRKRKVVELARLSAAFARLEGAPRDVLLLMAATGMHVTELERFVRRRENSELVDGNPAVLVVRHKSGHQTRIPLAIPEVVDAAKRLRVAGVMPRKMNAKIREACKTAGVEPFGLGVLRHTVATYAVEAGSSAKVVAEFLGHRDERTTRRFYVDAKVPTASVPVPALRLVGD